MAKVVGQPVEDDAVGNEIKRVIATADTLVTRLQQVLVLVDLTKTEIAIHCNDKLGEVHAMPNNSISKISVDPPGIPGCENLP